MPYQLEVVVPGPWWNTLSYVSDVPAAAGARVSVPLGKGKRVGFTVSSAPLSQGQSEWDSQGPEALERGLARNRKTVNQRLFKPIEKILDESSVLGGELWSLAGWIGRAFLCGMGEALQLVCPRQLLQGEPLAPRPADRPKGENTFREILYYHPLDGERFAYYRERISSGLSADGTFLALFPEARQAADFFAALPAALKSESLLWPSTGGKKLWDAWRKAASGEARAVIGSSGAVFAPAGFSEIIVDDEANPAYIFQRHPKISARSLAGRRALSLSARLVLGGRMPSAKTCARTGRDGPECKYLPQRKNLIFVDMKRSFKNEARGVEGQLPVTRALIERTRAALDEKHNALWIMDRKGQAGEVCCADCGASISCRRCGSVMRSERSGNASGDDVLRCVRCGSREPLPARCPACRGTLLLGKRPGLDALYPLAVHYMKGYEVSLAQSSAAPKNKRADKSAGPSLFLGTRGLLSLCDSLDVGLVAWLDLDAEARKIEYNARFQTFSMVWESYWRGVGDRGGERTVLAQTRRSGAWLESFRLGWEYFWKGELKDRKDLDLPPYTLLAEIALPPGENRPAFTDSLKKAGLFATSAGDDSPLWVSVKSTERLGAALAPRFEIARSRMGFPVVTIWTE